MTENLFDPTNEDGLIFAGTRADGTVSVVVTVRVRVPDAVGLRGKYLVEGDEVGADWGTEAAVGREVSEVLRHAPWAASGLEPVEARLLTGTTGGTIPENQFIG